ncbi:MAG: LuxR C-terminal-related transcriptional regulator [Bacteroidales bacterium]|jgi:DNA-binding CsgD family transcriptional regulator
MKSSKPRTILIADPSEVILQGLAALVEKAGGGEPYLCNTWNDALRIAEPGQVRCIIFGSGLAAEWFFLKSQLLKNFENALWAAFVYAPFFYEKEPSLKKIFRITDNYEEIISGIKKLLIQENPDELAVQQLTDREIEVLRLLVKGLSQKEIADILKVSIHTVISHRKNISEKTGIKSIAGLTIFAITQKYITP